MDWVRPLRGEIKMTTNVAAKPLTPISAHAAAMTWTPTVRRTGIAVAATEIVAATARAALQQGGDSIETVFT